METNETDSHFDPTDPSIMAGSGELRTVSVRPAGFAPQKTGDLVAPPRWQVNEQKRKEAAEREENTVTVNGARKVAKVAMKAARKAPRI